MNVTHSKPSIAFQTFGCRLNQAEAEGWQHALAAEGYPIVPPEAADVFCVHSCAVTEPAVREVAKLLRARRNRHPSQKLIVSGCATALLGDIALDLRIPHEQKGEWLPRVRTFLSALPPKAPGETPIVTSEHRRTRAALILQDGCDHFCAYCIVPHVRGKPVSESAERLLKQAQTLFANGYREIVLTGCHLALYRDPASGMDLIELLRRLCDVPGEGRFRIGSLEPCILDDTALIRLIASSKGRLCPFLHFPMQSADDTVLQKMRRRYRQKELRHVLDTVCATLPGCGLSADWIAGHPGETPQAAETTLAFVQAYPFTGAHVFPYSKRNGTPAATFPDQVPQQEILARAKRLRETAKDQQLAQLRRAIGTPLSVIPEQRHGEVRYGWSAERFRCQLPADYPRGECVTVVPSALEGETLIVTS